MSGADYERLLELGRGGMGAAHLARAVGAGGFERLVVVKRLLSHLMQHPEAVRRFLGEAKVAAALHHANIVGVHHSGRDDEGYYIVYDYVEGAALDELIDRAALRTGPLPVPIVLRIALDALQGLHAAHTARDNAGRELGILHRDISPENLLVGRDGVTRVLDFGIAKSVIASVTTDQNYLLGKLSFMAPEYLARKPITPSLDVYALGVSLWVALTGDMPWAGSSEAQLVVRITGEGLPRLSASGVRVPPVVDELIARATAMNPAERFPSALEMMEEIERINRETGWLASHREVAQLVDGHCGVDLERRRKRVSKIIDQATLPAIPLDAEEAEGSSAESNQSIALSRPARGRSMPEEALASEGASASAPGGTERRPSQAYVFIQGEPGAQGGPSPGTEPLLLVSTKETRVGSKARGKGLWFALSGALLLAALLAVGVLMPGFGRRAQSPEGGPAQEPTARVLARGAEAPPSDAPDIPASAAVEEPTAVAEEVLVLPKDTPAENKRPQQPSVKTAPAAATASSEYRPIAIPKVEVPPPSGSDIHKKNPYR